MAFVVGLPAVSSSIVGCRVRGCVSGGGLDTELFASRVWARIRCSPIVALSRVGRVRTTLIDGDIPYDLSILELNRLPSPLSSNPFKGNTLLINPLYAEF